MADNIELNAGSGGSTLATAEVTFSGDTSEVQIVGLGLITGSAESYAVQLAAGGAGAVGATVPRVTLASDDPAVAHLANVVTAVQLIDNAVSGAGFNITQFAGAAVPIGAGVEATALRVTLATDSTGVISVDDNGAALTVDNGGTFAVQVTGDALTALQLIDNAVSGAGFNITQFAGAAVPIGAGVEATALRVTLATDSTGVVSVDDNGATLSIDDGGGAITVDGTVTEASAASILTAVQLIDNTVAVLGTATYSEATTSGNVVGAVRNDELAALADTDNEIAPLQVDENGALMVSETSVACKRASGVAASGTTAIISAVVGKKFRIHALALFATSATVTNVYVATTTDTDVLGNAANPIPLATDADADNSAGFVLPWNPGGWTETSTANEALNLVLSAAQDVIWAITYSEVS